MIPTKLKKHCFKVSKDSNDFCDICEMNFRNTDVHLFAGENEKLSAYVTTTKDGDKWCCLYGDNLQTGHAIFADTIEETQVKMKEYLKL